jgi:hypothetical protein
MSRKKIGYRGRGISDGRIVYVQFIGNEFRWTLRPPFPQDRKTCRFEMKQAVRASVDSEGERIDVYDTRIVAVYLRTEKAKPAPTWPKNWGTGERVLLLAAQGFGGVGRRDAAASAEEMARTCRTDEDAFDLLRTFKPNELADLPFPIRDFLGIDEHGCFWNADQKRDAELHAADMKRMGYVAE